MLPTISDDMRHFTIKSYPHILHFDLLMNSGCNYAHTHSSNWIFLVATDLRLQLQFGLI
jgi:hypothetical protein